MMSKYLEFDFEHCRSLFVDAVTDSLRQSAGYIASAERNGRGELPVTGLSLDVFPDHGDITLSLRLSSDTYDFEKLYSPADWRHFQFVSSHEHDFAPLQAAVAYMRKVYEPFAEVDSDEATEIGHLTFLAAAHALLDESVCETLKSLDIDAPLWGGEMFSSRPHFEYLVMDDNANIRGNYCEVVRANKITERLLGHMA